MRSVVVLGATGSIGTQADEVIARHPEAFTVAGLAAGGNASLLAEQALRHRAPVVALADDGAADAFSRAFVELAGPGASRPDILAGPTAATELAGRGADIVLNGITGAVGLNPTLAALATGSTLALANKESLVIGGAIVRAARQRPDQIVPVDSEHSAIAQCLRGGAREEVARLVLTASGGPFRGKRRDELAAVTPDQALAHPTWAMGPVVTINSSTLVNKALEVIEAHLLFDVPLEQIDVVVHPQSIVHSMVTFRDGATIAQASPPTMLLPIALGLSWPDRLADIAPACDWRTAQSWQFEPLDEDAFPAIRIARASVAASPLHPAVFNAANEECVAAFLAGRLSYLDIVDTVAKVLGEFDDASAAMSLGGHTLEPGKAGAPTVRDVLAADDWARRRAREAAGHDTQNEGH